MTLSASALAPWQAERWAKWGPTALRLAVFAVIGIEIMTLASWLPETLRTWWQANPEEVGDFQFFYRSADESTTINKYNPGLAFLLKPLTMLDVATAFKVYFGVNVAALVGVAVLAQRGVRSIDVRVVVLLGVLALPPMHWALRVGHFTPILAFLLLSGFLLAERRPWLAGVLFGLIVLKPQYFPIPILYLAWSRNWRALLGASGTVAALTLAGIAIVGVDAFTAQIDTLVQTPLDQSQRYLPAQQAWQYSWQGFLVSAGIRPSTLLTIDLLLLSLGVVVFAWYTATPSVAKVAAALGILLLAPYSTFYNWGMIAVAGALLLRSDLRPRALIPLLLGGGVIAIAATQRATPFPSPNLLLSGTNGLYWIQPFALGAVAVLAIAGRRRRRDVGEAAEEEAVPLRETLARWIKVRPRALTSTAPRIAVWAGAAATAVAAGYFVSAYVSQSGPFETGRFDRQTVVQALPADFPVPSNSEITEVGEGRELLYRIAWSTPHAFEELATLMTEVLDEGSWSLSLVEEEEQQLSVRALHGEAQLDLFADLLVVPLDEGSLLTLEFLPTSGPEFDKWLAEKEAREAAE